MSYCEIIPFIDGKPKGGIEFRNAWGGCARIWSALFDSYLKNPAIPHHTWLGNADALWTLAKRMDLPMFERAVHAATFDLAFIRHDHFSQFVTDLRLFAAKYPAGKSIDHLCAWAAEIEVSDAEAIGFYGNSVSENLWWKYDEPKDESVPVPLTEGFEVYDWIATLT